MGITIHFKGRLNNLQEINSVMDDLIDISETMQWKWTFLEEDWNKPATAQLSVIDNRAEITGHLGLKGVQINIHPDCESLEIYFDMDMLEAALNSVDFQEFQGLSPEEMARRLEEILRKKMN